MTGRDLIIYIMKNNLENEPVFKDGKFIGFMTAGEAAEQMGVGLATVATLVAIDQIQGFLIGDTIYIPADAELLLRNKESCTE